MNILHWVALVVIGLAVVAGGVILLIRRAERLIYGKHDKSAEELARRWKEEQ